MTIQQLLLASIPDSVTVVTSSGTGSITTPVGYKFVTVEAIGGGGNGFGASAASNRAGGGGGQYAKSDANISVTPSTTIVYYSVGTAVANSWVNVGTNAAPATSTVGCLARNGSSATSGVAGVGNLTGSVGSVTNNGGNGTTGGSAAGGGGAGASSAGSGTTAGTDTTGVSPQTLMGDGTGGAYTVQGTEPGGGGGGATAGTNPAGAVGRIRIRFTQYSV